MTDEIGTIRHLNGRYQACLIRHLPYERTSVWAMLTEPVGLRDWLAPGDIEIREGGRVRLDFADSGTVIDSRVRTIEAPRLLEYSWSAPTQPTRPVRWELSSEDAGTHLVLTLEVPETEDIARTCAGWEAHLQMLGAALAGTPIAFPFERFQAAREAYRGAVPP